MPMPHSTTDIPAGPDQWRTLSYDLLSRAAGGGAYEDDLHEVAGVLVGDIAELLACLEVAKRLPDLTPRRLVIIAKLRLDPLYAANWKEYVAYVFLLVERADTLLRSDMFGRKTPIPTPAIAGRSRPYRHQDRSHKTVRSPRKRLPFFLKGEALYLFGLGS
jgi:hypothetical protein